MYKYLFGGHPKKSPGLPFFKMSLKNTKKKNDISSRMNRSLIYLSKETELLVLGNNYLSLKQQNKNNNKSEINKQNTQEENIDIFNKENKEKEKTAQTSTKKIKKIRQTKLKSSKDYLTQRLNKVILRGKNKKRLLNISSLNSDSSKMNNLSVKQYYSNNTYRKNDSTNNELSTMRNILSKNQDMESSEKHLFQKVLSNKRVKNNTYRNISRLSSLLNDTSKKYIILNMKLKDYTKENSFKNIKKNILDKSLKQSKSQENMDLKKINFKKIFDKKDSVLDKPMVQIKDEKKNRMIWIKKSTANLLSFGKVSNSMKDEQFYKERKRIIESYLNYEKAADLYVSKKESEKNSFRNERGYKNLRKIDELLAQNKELIKNILKKMKIKKIFNIYKKYKLGLD